MESELEKRIFRLSRVKITSKIKAVDDLKTIVDLKELYDGYKEPALQGLKTSPLTKPFARWIDWDKTKNAFYGGIDIFYKECGEGILKEWQIVKKARDLDENEFKKEFRYLIMEVYGSFRSYKNYAYSLQRFAKETTNLINETKWNFLERILIKKMVAEKIIKAHEKKSKEIIDYCESFRKLYCCYKY